MVKPSEVSPASAAVIESIIQNHLDPRAFRTVQVREGARGRERERALKVERTTLKSFVIYNNPHP